MILLIVSMKAWSRHDMILLHWMQKKRKIFKWKKGLHKSTFLCSSSKMAFIPIWDVFHVGTMPTEKVHYEHCIACGVFVDFWCLKINYKCEMWFVLQISLQTITPGTDYVWSGHTRDMKKLSFCAVCGYHSPYRATVTRHALIHSGEKPFICPVCGKGFSRRDSLMCHVVALHPNPLQWCHIEMGDSLAMSWNKEWRNFYVCLNEFFWWYKMSVNLVKEFPLPGAIVAVHFLFKEIFQMIFEIYRDIWFEWSCIFILWLNRFILQQSTDIFYFC